MTKIDRDSPIPLYYQLKQILLQHIESGEWGPGHMLPTEQQIRDEHQVSRTTVRQALSELAMEGKVYRYRGRGSFVAKPKVSHNPEQYPSLADHLLAQGMVPGWTVLSADWMVPPADIAVQLKVTRSDRVFQLRRLRLENDEPIGYHIAYVSPRYADEIDETAFAEGGSLRYLRGHGLLENCTANRVLEAVQAGPEEASLLNVPKGAAMLLIRRLVLDEYEQPVEAFRGVYRGDRFQYHINNMRAISPINA